MKLSLISVSLGTVIALGAAAFITGYNVAMRRSPEYTTVFIGRKSTAITYGNNSPAPVMIVDIEGHWHTLYQGETFDSSTNQSNQDPVTMHEL